MAGPGTPETIPGMASIPSGPRRWGNGCWVSGTRCEGTGGVVLSQMGSVKEDSQITLR